MGQKINYANVRLGNRTSPRHVCFCDRRIQIYAFLHFARYNLRQTKGKASQTRCHCARFIRRAGGA